ncbi:MAG: hypothetical protein WC729_19870 [Sphingomonas sp.]|jgi:hypothetical protein|uniref:hypothetical protein n=1 Tax=Sphingomonas sp. TaxID=28214 RepID=UPI00356482A8
MKAQMKIPRKLLAGIRQDLRRPHSFAYERIGFLTAGAVRMDNGDVVLLAREYQPVADEDYVPNPRVGAMIGPDAMRKGLQLAYKSRSALVHLHTHGGTGRPEFSGVDLDDGKKFVPSFFNVVSHMPHALLVLSDDSARGLLWMGKTQPPVYFEGFTQIGAPLLKFGGPQ